ncbi:hypothetical protein CPC08DRAFT_822619 [Agrocybe pediades]|nr:hypothetical protein CPC08DRAFT_822619 [Agrocybe pediades]
MDGPLYTRGSRGRGGIMHEGGGRGRPHSRNKHWSASDPPSRTTTPNHSDSERWERGGHRGGGRGRGRGAPRGAPRTFPNVSLRVNHAQAPQQHHNRPHFVQPTIPLPQSEEAYVEEDQGDEEFEEEDAGDGEEHADEEVADEEVAGDALFPEIHEPVLETAEEREKFYQELVKAREQERKRAIAEGKMDDPLVPKRLEDAISIVGTCMDMCPRFERYRRERENNLFEWETIPGTKRVDHNRAVKMYERAAGDKTLPSDLRPPIVLKRTLDYLFHDLLPRGGFSATFNFIRDRSRAVRNDFTMQHITGPLAIECHDRCARFHILALHFERDRPGFSIPLEEQQLMNTLQSLKEFYEDQRGRYESPNELEMRVYHRLIHIRDQKERHEDIPESITSHPVFKLTTQFRLHVQQKSAPISKTSKLVVTEEGMQIFSQLAAVLSEQGSRVMVYLVACLLERLFGNDTIDDIESIRGDLSISDIIDGITSHGHVEEAQAEEEAQVEGEGEEEEYGEGEEEYEEDQEEDIGIEEEAFENAAPVAVPTAVAPQPLSWQPTLPFNPPSSTSAPQPQPPAAGGAFANLVTQPNVFGTVFGGTGSVFGTQPQQQQPAAKPAAPVSVFGGSQPPSSSVFGTLSSAPAAASGQASSPFGNIFGQPITAAPSAQPQPLTAQPTLAASGFGFGNNATTSTTTTTAAPLLNPKAPEFTPSPIPVATSNSSSPFEQPFSFAASNGVAPSARTAAAVSPKTMGAIPNFFNRVQPQQVQPQPPSTHVPNFFNKPSPPLTQTPPPAASSSSNVSFNKPPPPPPQTRTSTTPPSNRLVAPPLLKIDTNTSTSSSSSGTNGSPSVAGAATGTIDSPRAPPPMRKKQPISLPSTPTTVPPNPLLDYLRSSLSGPGPGAGAGQGWGGGPSPLSPGSSEVLSPLVIGSPTGMGGGMMGGKLMNGGSFFGPSPGGSRIFGRSPVTSPQKGGSGGGALGLNGVGANGSGKAHMEVKELERMGDRGREKKEEEDQEAKEERKRKRQELAFEFERRSLVVRRAFGRWLDKAVERAVYLEARRQEEEYKKKKTSTSSSLSLSRSRASVNGLSLVNGGKRRAEMEDSELMARQRKKARRKRVSSEYKPPRTDEELARRLQENHEEHELRWAPGSFLKVIKKHAEAASTSTSTSSSSSSSTQPSHSAQKLQLQLQRRQKQLPWNLWLSMNPESDATAIWLERKFDVPASGRWASESVFEIPVLPSGSSPSAGNGYPGLVVFECTPLGEIGDELEKKYRVLDDCSRLRELVGRLDGKRHFDTSLLIISWSSEEGKKEDEEVMADFYAMVKKFVEERTILSYQKWAMTSTTRDLDTKLGAALEKMEIDVRGKRVMRVESVKSAVGVFESAFGMFVDEWMGNCEVYGRFNWSLYGHVVEVVVKLLNAMSDRVCAMLELGTPSVVKLPEFEGGQVDDSDSAYDDCIEWLATLACREDARLVAVDVQSHRDIGQEFPARLFIEHLFELTEILLERTFPQVAVEQRPVLNSTVEETLKTFMDKDMEPLKMKLFRLYNLSARRSPKRRAYSVGTTEYGSPEAKRPRLSDSHTNEDRSVPSTPRMNGTRPDMTPSPTNSVESMATATTTATATANGKETKEKESPSVTVAMLRALTRDLKKKYGGAV